MSNLALIRTEAKIKTAYLIAQIEYYTYTTLRQFKM